MNLGIIGFGATTAMGTSWGDTMKGLAADTVVLKRQRQFMGPDFKPLLTAFEGPILTCGFADRITALAQLALDDLAEALAGQNLLIERNGVRLAVCAPAVPVSAQPRLSAMTQTLGARISKLLECPILSAELFCRDGAGFAQALRSAQADLEKGVPLIVICTDSFNNQSRLRVLGDRQALFSNRTPYGFIPGEGAAALLLRPVQKDSGDYAQIAGVGTATDQIPEGASGDSPYTAMVEACWDALSKKSSSVAHWISDWNNSRYRAAELSYAKLRTQKAHSGSLRDVHLALSLGDVGAAYPAIAVGIAASYAAPALVSVSGGVAQQSKSALYLIPRMFGSMI